MLYTLRRCEAANYRSFDWQMTSNLPIGQRLSFTHVSGGTSTKFKENERSPGGRRVLSSQQENRSGNDHFFHDTTKQ